MTRQNLCDKLNEHFKDNIFMFVPSEIKFSIEKISKHDDYVESSILNIADAYYIDLEYELKQICGKYVDIQLNNTGSIFSLWVGNESFFDTDKDCDS